MVPVFTGMMTDSITLRTYGNAESGRWIITTQAHYSPDQCFRADGGYWWLPEGEELS